MSNVDSPNSPVPDIVKSGKLEKPTDSATSLEADSLKKKLSIASPSNTSSVSQKRLKSSQGKMIDSNKVNPFHATGLFLYPLKTLENQSFFDVFRSYRIRKSSVAWNRLMSKVAFNQIFCLDLVSFFLIRLNDLIRNTSTSEKHCYFVIVPRIFWEKVFFVVCYLMS